MGHGSGLDTTVFHELLNGNLPLEEKTKWRMWQEGLSLVGGGAETTANAFAVTNFHFLDNAYASVTLQAELRGALLDLNVPVELIVVEKLPYLVSGISGIPRTRLTRIDCCSERRFEVSSSLTNITLTLAG